MHKVSSIKKLLIKKVKILKFYKEEFIILKQKIDIEYKIKITASFKT